MFLVSLIVGSLIVNSFSLIMHLITFYTLNEKGILALFTVISEIFAGGLVPIAFFPKYLKIIADILPFKYTVDLPFRIYTGNISINNSIRSLIFGIIWLIVLIIVGSLISKNVSKKVVVQGG